MQVDPGAPRLRRDRRPVDVLAAGADEVLLRQLDRGGVPRATPSRPRAAGHRPPGTRAGRRPAAAVRPGPAPAPPHLPPAGPHCFAMTSASTPATVGGAIASPGLLDVEDVQHPAGPADHHAVPLGGLAVLHRPRSRPSPARRRRAPPGPRRATPRRPGRCPGCGTRTAKAWRGLLGGRVRGRVVQRAGRALAAAAEHPQDLLLRDRLPVRRARRRSRPGPAHPRSAPRWVSGLLPGALRVERLGLGGTEHQVVGQQRSAVGRRRLGDAGRRRRAHRAGGLRGRRGSALVVVAEAEHGVPDRQAEHHDRRDDADGQGPAGALADRPAVVLVLALVEVVRTRGAGRCVAAAGRRSGPGQDRGRLVARSGGSAARR